LKFKNIFYKRENKFGKEVLLKKIFFINGNF
jgi:hypothetical protein